MSYSILVIGVLLAAATFAVSVLSEKVKGGKWDKPLEWAVVVSALAMFLWTVYSLHSSFLHRKSSVTQFQTVFRSTDSLKIELRERSQSVDSLRRVNRNQRESLERLTSSTKASARLISDLSSRQSELVEKADSLRQRAGKLEQDLNNRASTVQVMTVISPSSGRLTSHGPKSFDELNPFMGKVKNEAAFVEQGLSPMYSPLFDPSSDGSAIDLCHLRMKQADKRLRWAAIAMANKMHSSTENFSSPRLLLFEPCEDSRHFGQSGLSPLSMIHSLYLYSDVPILKRIVENKARGVKLGFVIRVNDELTYYKMQGNINNSLNESMEYIYDQYARQKQRRDCLKNYNGDVDELSTGEREFILEECGIDKLDLAEEVERKQRMVKLATDTSAVVVPLRRFDRFEVSVESLSQLALLPPLKETIFNEVWARSAQSLTSPQKSLWDLSRSFRFRGSKKDVGVAPTQISYFGIGEGQATYYNALSRTEYHFHTKYFYDYACNTDTALPEILDEVTPEEGRANQWMIVNMNTDMGLEELPYREGRYVRLGDFLRVLEASETKKLYSEADCKDSQEYFGNVDNVAD